MIQPTSLEAYQVVLETLGERQQQVYKCIKFMEAGTNSMISKKLGLPINCITPRTNELVKLGLVREAKTDMCPITKRKAIFWRIEE